MSSNPYKGMIGVDATTPRLDWPSAKARYVEGFLDGERQVYPTLEEVARWLGCAPGTVRMMSGREGWTEARRQWQQKVERERQNRRAKQLAAAADDLDKGALNVAELGIGLVRDRLAEAEEDWKAGLGHLPPRDLTALGQAADLFHRIGLRALGDPDTQRLEITGANGQPLDLASTLARDDPARLSGVLAVLHAAGVTEDVFDVASNEVGTGDRGPED